MSRRKPNDVIDTGPAAEPAEAVDNRCPVSCSVRAALRVGADSWTHTDGEYEDSRNVVLVHLRPVLLHKYR